MNALEQSFADLCAKHDLTCLGVNLYPDHGDARFTVYAHGRDRVLGSGNRATISEAIGSALTELAVKRNASPITLADEPLTEMAA